MITINHRFSGAALFECEAASTKIAVEMAIKAKESLSEADLSGAYLRGANLSGANLGEAYLRRANLRGAYLGGANLSGANLSEANLSGAYLSGVYLSGANLSEAYLGGADLRAAYLGGADLRGANLSEAYLGGADLRGANLGGANIVDGGQRSDGYRFVGQVRDGSLWIHAGCRYWPVNKAREHWGSTDYRNRTLGDESLVIIDAIEKRAIIRGLMEAAE